MLRPTLAFSAIALLGACSVSEKTTVKPQPTAAVVTSAPATPTTTMTTTTPTTTTYSSTGPTGTSSTTVYNR